MYETLSNDGDPNYQSLQTNGMEYLSMYVRPQSAVVAVHGREYNVVNPASRDQTSDYMF